MTGNLPARSQATAPAVLADLANKINVCIVKADDYRVTAAQHLAEAKKVCGAAGISFKEWCARGIKYSYAEAVKLAKIGASDDPVAALADMRQKNVARNRAHRDKVVSRDTTLPARKVPPEEAALAAIDRLSPDTRRNLIKSHVTAGMLTEIQRAMIVPKTETFEEAQSAFEAALQKVDHAARVEAIIGLMRALGLSLKDLRDRASVPDKEGA